MTTICTDGVSMAGDGAQYLNDTMAVSNAVKVHRLPDGSLVGCCGGAEDGAALVEWLTTRKGKRPQARSLAALVLLPSGDLIYYAERGGGVPSQAPAAIGSGSTLALGAMLAGASPAQAVAIAAQRDAFTGGSITVEVLG